MNESFRQKYTFIDRYHRDRTSVFNERRRICYRRVELRNKF